MKIRNIVRAGILPLLLALFVVSCEQQESIDPINSGGLKAVEETSYMVVSEFPGDVCSSIEHYGLVAGQHIDVGGVIVGSSPTHLYVEVSADADYLISEVHIYAGNIDELPLNKKGNPVIGKFPVAFENSEGQSSVILEISRNGLDDFIDLAVHAVVINEEGTFDETAWGTSVSREGNVVFALKSLVWAEYGFGVTLGTTIAPLCSHSTLFGYFDIDLATFTSETYPLGTLYDGAQIGSVDVELVDGVLSFDIVSLEEDVVQKSWLYVGSLEDLGLYVEGDCVDYESFPHTDLVTAPSHHFEVTVGTASSTATGTMLDSQRWGFYIDGLALCN